MWFFKINAQDVIEVILNALRGVFAWLCEIIYPWIAKSYDLFIELGRKVYSDDFTVIYDKISLIIGIFMVFRVIFWLIESLVNPDAMSDKEKSPQKIIIKILVSVILLATTPKIFNAAFYVQDKILESNIIENIISTGQGVGDTTVGKYLSAELFVNFYTPELNERGEVMNNTCVIDYTQYEGDGFIYNELYQHGELKSLTNYCLTEKGVINPSADKKNQKEAFVINFNGLFAVAVGGFVLWMIIMYCISLGTRYVQLIYLQVIAPIPIMCNIAPGKDNMFSKWIKQCTTTYLDLFIRIAIINFVMLLCSIILSNDSGAVASFNNTNGWIQVFLVLGLLTFAKKAPDLIQELLPKSLTKASGDFGLSFKKRAENMVGGKYIGKGYEKATGLLKSAGKMPFSYLASVPKNIITGVDSYKNGKGFWNGYYKNPGKLGQWWNKQRETLTPESYKAHKLEIEGRENVNSIDTKWHKGKDLATKMTGAGISGVDESGNRIIKWQDAFNGTDSAKSNYNIFKSEKFRNSKMAVDRASENEKRLRYLQQELMASGTVPEGGAKVRLINSDGSWYTETITSVEDVTKKYDKAQKTLKGAEEVHAEISKQEQGDAAIESALKFYKNNEVNPANPNETHGGGASSIQPQDTPQPQQPISPPNEEPTAPPEGYEGFDPMTDYYDNGETDDESDDDIEDFYDDIYSQQSEQDDDE